MAMSPKTKQPLLLISIFGGTVLLIILYYHFALSAPKIKGMNTEREKVETKTKNDKAELDRFRAFIKDEVARAEVYAAFERISTRLPSNQDPVEVFELLREYFEETDVEFTYLEPGKATNRVKYMEFPFKIRGSARYHEFGQFVNLIECNPRRLMHVNSFNLTNNDTRPSIHPMEVGISTFGFQ
jgi:Tfp pilus assembly protein PilO